MCVRERERGRGRERQGERDRVREGETDKVTQGLSSASLPPSHVLTVPAVEGRGVGEGREHTQPLGMGFH